jgi:hypothetical protein
MSTDDILKSIPTVVSIRERPWDHKRGKSFPKPKPTWDRRGGNGQELDPFAADKVLDETLRN